VLQVYPVLRVSLEIMVALVMLGPQVNLVPLELKDRKVTKEVKAQLVQLVNLDPKVHLVIVVCQVCLDLLALLVLVVSVDQLVKLDPQVDLEMKVHLVLLVFLGPSALLDHLVNLDQKDLLAKKDLPVLAVVQVTKDPLAMLVRLDLLDHLACPVLPVKLDPLDQLANAALLEKLDPWVLKDLKDLEANPEHLDHKANVENVVRLVAKVLKVIAVLLVCRVFPVLLVLKETRDQWVLLVHLARAANLDLKVRLAATDLLDHKVSWAHLVPEEALVNLVNLVHLVLLVHLDLLDLLVNQWDMMLLHWLLFLGKVVRPRALIRWLVTILPVYLLNLPMMTAKPLSSRLTSSSKFRSKNTLNQAVTRLLPLGPAEIWRSLIQNFHLANTGSILTKGTPRTLFWSSARWNAEPLASDPSPIKQSILHIKENLVLKFGFLKWILASSLLTNQIATK